MRRIRTLMSATVALVLVVSAAPVLAAEPSPQPPRSHAERGLADGERQPLVTGDDLAGEQTGTVDLLSGSWWVDSDDYLNIVGEVYNGTSVRRQFIELDFTLLDAADNIIDTTFTYADVDSLAPGMVSPFLVYEPAPPGIADVTGVVGTGSIDSGVPAGALLVTAGTAYDDMSGYRHYPGTVKNLATFPIEFTSAHLTLYDSMGEVVNTEWDYATLAVIPAGGTSSFEVIVGAYEGAVRSSIVAQARRDDQISVYTTSWNNYFNDIGFSQFRTDIIWNAEQGITTGCGAALFCPGSSVPRDQMASFLARALGLTGSAPDAFTDDEGNPHEPNINLVAAANIASGCAAGKFCPSSKVLRDQMASFLSRALTLSGPAPDAFTDDEGNIHEPNINLVAREGVASGCGPQKYCPSNQVTRGQMAAFLRRAFD